MLKNYTILNGKLTECEDAAAARVLVFVNPTDAEKKLLVDHYVLDEHTLASALDPDELSRLEFEPEHTAIIYKRPRNYSSQDQFLFRVFSTGLFLFKDRLIVVVPEDCILFEGKRFARITSLQDVVLGMLHRSIFHFEEHLRVINMVSMELEHEINTSMTNKHLLNLFTLEKSLVYYLNAINANANLIGRIRNSAAKIDFNAENIEFVDDLSIENNQCYRVAEIYSQVLSGLMDARASIVSNNLNVLMKTLTLVMIAIMVPTLVISIFSMNVKLPVEQEASVLSFWIILILAALSFLGVFVVWRYKKW